MGAHVFWWQEFLREVAVALGGPPMKRAAPISSLAISKRRPRARGDARREGSVRASQSRDVLDALRRIVRELRRSSTDAERTLGVSAAQLFVLQVLGETPGASINDLAARTNTDQSSVSVVVQRLARAELVARTVAPTDGRRVELRLTAAGRRLIAQRPEPAQMKLFAALDRLSPAELASLRESLAAVVREMRIADAPPSMFFEDDEPPAPKPRRATQTATARKKARSQQ